MSNRNEPTTATSPSKRTKRRAAQKQVEPPAVTKVMTDFAACGRCSYFWAGYRVIAGEEGIETAVNDTKNNWLTLTWNQAMRELVHKSYGVMVDTSFFHYESCCQECHRAFTCSATTRGKAEVILGDQEEAADVSPTLPLTVEATAVERTTEDEIKETPKESETKASAFDFCIQLLRQNPARP